MKIDSTVVREGREYMVCCEYDSTVLVHSNDDSRQTTQSTESSK